MAEIVNLRLARKAKKRKDEAEAAQRNRVLHGRTKAERTAVETERDRDMRLLDAHRLDRPEQEP